MPLLPEDAQFLSDKRIVFEVHEEAGMMCVVLHKWPLPYGLNHEAVDVLILLAPGYPDIAPDMWWVDPPLRLTSGGEIPSTSSIEPHLGRQWQRWSRHFTAGQWQPGIDRLESYLALMIAEFRRTAEIPA